MKATCNEAAKKGWTPTAPGVSGQGAMLAHPDLPGHKVHVGADGKWSHMAVNSVDGSSKMHDSGEDADSLKDHLRQLHMGLAKRGPRVA
jgi:hypothetical protein